MKVIATTARGIEKVEEFDGGVEPMNFDVFTRCLRDLGDDSVDICCDLTDAQAEQLEAEYGIK